MINRPLVSKFDLSSLAADRGRRAPRRLLLARHAGQSGERPERHSKCFVCHNGRGSRSKFFSRAAAPESCRKRQSYSLFESLSFRQIDLGRVLAALEPIRTSSAAVANSAFDPRSVIVGERDKKFWPYVARIAHQAQILDALIEDTMEINNMMLTPLPQPEVAAKCKYWFDKTQKGKNWFGVGNFVRIDHAIVDGLMMSDPDAFQLLMFARRHHWGRDFCLANEACSLMPGGGWRRQRFTGARSRLINGGYFNVVKPATFQPPSPMLLRLSNNGQQ